MAVAGLRGTGDWGADERPKNFREMILWMNPNGTSPIFALSSKASKESTDDPEFSWWSEPNDQIRLTTSGATAIGATAINVTGAEPSAAGLGVNWGSALSLKAGDILMVEPAADTAVFTPEYVIVTQTPTSATVIPAVTRGFAGSAAAAYTGGEKLLLVGSAYAEGTSSPSATTRNPIKYSNLTQIFKNVYSITGTAEQTKTRTGDTIKNDKRRKSFDHAAQIEYAMIFGRKSEGVGSNGKPLRTMDGIRRFVPNAVFTAGATMNTFLDAVYPVFDFDSDAGDTRMAFCGNGALNALNKAIMNASGTSAMNVNFNGPIKVYGVNFNEYIIPQGRLLLKTHPLFNRNSLYTNSMLVLDFSAFKWRPLRNRDTKFQDDIQTKREDLREGQWLTEAGIEVWHGGLTSKWLGNVNLVGTP